MYLLLLYLQFIFSLSPVVSALPYAEIQMAFEENSAESVMSFCENPILLILDDQEGVYNHAQASMILGAFFKRYPNGAFEYQFQGSEENSDIFSAATYILDSERFQVQFSFSNNKPNKIQSIRFEK